jgi:carboxyl-terminal processing protease
MMMRKTSLILLGAAAGVAVALIATQPRIVLDGARAQTADADTYRQLSLFGDVFERLRADYVEKPDDSKLIESAINGMLAGLDPHSSYMDSKSFRDMQVQTRGEFGGLGIEVTMEDGLIKVVAPIDETPAAKAGIMANDIITHLDDAPVQGLTLNQAVEKMRGPENSKIKLKIMRKGQDKPIEISITRARIQVRSVRSRLEGDDVGFIRVTQFNEQTTEDLKKAITDLSTQAGDKLKGFIIDLRNNPGGLLDQAISVSDAFLEKGEIVSTRGRTAEEIQRFNARAGDLTKNKPVIVLINGGSASASEIVAGALQDHRRATVIGTRSFGKGSVQTIIPLGAGNGALRLTTGRYFTPSGRSIQAKGISPDIEVLQDVPEELKARTDTRGEASLRGHLKAEGDEQTGSQSYIPPDPKDDKALHTALDLIRGIQKNSAYPPNPNTAVPELESRFATSSSHRALGAALTRETLRSAFREELDRGRAIASQAVANALFNNAVHSNNVAAQIWWSKARMRWSETLGHQMLDEHGKPTAPVIVRAAVLFEAALFLPHSTQARADVDRVT